MLSREGFIRLSLELNLFFLRIMKEHSFFLEAGFTPKNANLAQEADAFKNQFSELLEEAVFLSNGIISPEVAASNEIITPFTLEAERATEFFTGVPLNTNITVAETSLVGHCHPADAKKLVQRVFMLNQKAIALGIALIKFKTRLLANVLSCKLFTFNYPLLIDHILRETKLFVRLLQQLQAFSNIDSASEIIKQEAFWNRIMAEHAKFIRGLLDPTEEVLIKTAHNFARQFDELTEEAKAAISKTIPSAIVTARSLEATKGISNFKAEGTQGILQCKIQSIIVPLLGDHVLREANHYLRLLKMLEKKY